MIAHLNRIPVFLVLLIIYAIVSITCAVSYLINGDEDCFVVCTHHIRYSGP